MGSDELHELRCSRMPVIVLNAEELGGLVIGRVFVVVVVV